MKEILLVKLGEIVLKGLNRKAFEDTLLKNIRRRLSQIGKFTVRISQSTITVTPFTDDEDMDEAEECISKIFGIASYSRACVAEKDIEDIKQKAAEYLKDVFDEISSFIKLKICSCLAVKGSLLVIYILLFLFSK